MHHIFTHSFAFVFIPTTLILLSLIPIMVFGEGNTVDILSPIQNVEATSLAITPAIVEEECDEHLESYIKLGEANNPEDVRKLQIFLRDFEGFVGLRVTGEYTRADFDAVSTFQARYFEDVLAPWGIKAPTGYAYITTQKKINEIYCGKVFPLSAAQLAEIVAYRESIEAGSIPHSSLESAGKEGHIGTPIMLTDGSTVSEKETGTSTENTSVLAREEGIAVIDGAGVSTPSLKGEKEDGIITELQKNNTVYNNLVAGLSGGLMFTYPHVATLLTLLSAALALFLIGYLLKITWKGLQRTGERNLIRMMPSSLSPYESEGGDTWERFFRKEKEQEAYTSSRVIILSPKKEESEV